MIIKRTPAPWTRAGVGVGMKSQATPGITAPTRRRSKPEPTNAKPQLGNRDALRRGADLSRGEMTLTMISPTLHPNRCTSRAHSTRGFRHPGLANPPDQVLVDRTWHRMEGSGAGRGSTVSPRLSCQQLEPPYIRTQWSTPPCVFRVDSLALSIPQGALSHRQVLHTKASLRPPMGKGSIPLRRLRVLPHPEAGSATSPRSPSPTPPPPTAKRPLRPAQVKRQSRPLTSLGGPITRPWMLLQAIERAFTSVSPTSPRSGWTCLRRKRAGRWVRWRWQWREVGAGSLRS